LRPLLPLENAARLSGQFTVSTPAVSTRGDVETGARTPASTVADIELEYAGGGDPKALRLAGPQDAGSVG